MEKPNAARAKLGRVARGVFLVCHEAHLLRVLLSGKPGAVQWGQSASNLIPATRSVEALLAFYDFPAEHWDHLRTANPIESVFATVRHRTIRTKGSRSQKTVKLMVFKLVQAASKTWRRLNGRNQLPKLIEGIKFTDGVDENDVAETNAA